MFRPLLAALALCAIPPAQLAAQDLWDQSVIRDFKFTFAQPSFWQALLGTRTSGSDISADLDVDGRTYKNVGIRIRASSSSSVGGNKMPFNLTLDSFVPGQELYGVSTVNLNNGAVDPTLTRETISYHVMRHYIPAPRTNYIRVHLNGSYWGLYLLVEQPNKAFLRTWFADDEGTRYKGDRPGGASVGTSRLNWLGATPSLYQSSYEAKTPTHPNVWTDLIRMIDKLNNTPAATFKAEAEKVINIDRALWYFALHNLLINSDDYMGAGHNYYMYFDPADSRMNMIPWDLNEAFGVHGPSTNPWNYSVLQNASSTAYPLVQRLLGVPEWRELYYAHYRTAMKRWMDWTNVLGPLNAQFQNRIRADVLADPNLLYPTYFNPSFPGRVFLSFHYVHGLQEVAIGRQQYLSTLPDLTKPEPQISQVTPLQPTVAPGQPFWVTARVTGTPAITAVELRSAVAGVYTGNTMYDDGMHRDGAANDGVFGGSFTAGGPLQLNRYYVHARNAANTVQVYPLEAEHVFLSVRSSSGPAVGPIVINEILADNETIDRDEGGDFDDWVELYNTGSQPYDLGGHYLTDDPANPAKWRFPANTIVPAGGFVRVWCDEEPLEGPLHANFKLAKQGEVLALFDTDANNRRFLDGVQFDEQKADRSYGRVPDGSGELFYSYTPTPNAPFVAPGAFARYDGRRTGSPRNFDLKGSGTARVQQPITLRLEGARPNASVAFMLSLRPLKVAVPPLGILGIDPIPSVLLFLSADATGVAALTATVPGGTAGARVYSQGLDVDLSNALVFSIGP
ncbi:MAG: CotH kinase family protein [Planctomycetes bacterium]|nr:CotH kinase family protein [Planctomycetota bacterium]MCB9869664.1 CotH kinase family protein [Planctomycetota bacterium]